MDDPIPAVNEAAILLNRARAAMRTGDWARALELLSEARAWIAVAASRTEWARDQSS